MTFKNKQTQTCTLKRKRLRKLKKSDQSFQPQAEFLDNFLLLFFNTSSLEPQGSLLAERDQLERQGSFEQEEENLN